MNGKVDFVAIATPLVEREFRVTPVHPETKMGVMNNWQKFQLTTIDDVRKYAEYFPHHNVGVVGKRGVGRHCFLDVDAPGVVERIEKETQHEKPQGYRVKSSLTSKPYKTHFYFKQTQYSFEKFGGWESVKLERQRYGDIWRRGQAPDTIRLERGCRWLTRCWGGLCQTDWRGLHTWKLTSKKSGRTGARIQATGTCVTRATGCRRQVGHAKLMRVRLEQHERMLWAWSAGKQDTDTGVQKTLLRARHRFQDRRCAAPREG